MHEQNARRLPLGVKIGYGSASCANGMVFTLVTVYLLIFLTDVVKLSPAFAGFAVMTGMLWDACLNPAVGIGSDRLRSRWGRRRPFLLVVALPFAVAVWLLFSDFGLSSGWAKLYFPVMTILYFSANACLEVPYTSLAAEMTQDYDERTSLLGYRMAWSQMGSIAGAAFPLLLVAYFAARLGSARAGWSAMACVFGLVSVPAILLTWRATRGLEIRSESVRVNLAAMVKDALQNRPYRYAVGLWTFGGIAMGISGNLIMYFMTYALDFSEGRSSLALLIFFACGTLWIPVINKTSALLGKRWAFIIYVGVWALAQGGGAFFIYPETAWLFFATLFLASSGVAAFFVIGYGMIADVVEVDEFKSGQRREGFYFGSVFFVQKIATAFAVWMIGIILTLVGYVPDVVQTDTALLGIRALYGFGSLAAFFVSIVCCALVPINRRNHTALCEAMRLKAEGKPYDTEAFDSLIR
jgi:GPH family glycoside/pentoside/hexuronide:cation symporter